MGLMFSDLSVALGSTLRRIPEAFEWNLEKGISVDTGLHKVGESKPHLAGNSMVIPLALCLNNHSGEIVLSA